MILLKHISTNVFAREVWLAGELTTSPIGLPVEGIDEIQELSYLVRVLEEVGC